MICPKCGMSLHGLNCFNDNCGWLPSISDQIEYKKYSNKIEYKRFIDERPKIQILTCKICKKQFRSDDYFAHIYDCVNSFMEGEDIR